ncbi:MAG TPA: hypothetical protein VLA26_03245 [Gammaproteobacteria bacterium]|nr:hypothetical protein [Gammaproteobacteria bacterium]
MDYRIAVDDTSGWGKATISGEITPQGLVEMLEAAWSHPQYSRVEAAIWNFLDAHTTMRLDDLLQFNAWVATTKRDRGAKTIAIVAADDVIFGVGRMFHAVQPELGWKLCIFRDEPEAIAWLRSETTPG